MGISYIKIENYKSIKSIYMEIAEINALIGGNGSGKSNIISAIRFFYENMCKSDSMYSLDIFDKNNKYSNEVRITVGYDLRKLQMRCCENIRKSPDSKYSNFYQDVISLGKQNSINLTMIVIRDKKIIWNCSYNERKLLFNLYPMYIIDTRKIDLLDWENLWLQIGDLGKMSNIESNNVKENIEIALNISGNTNKVYNKIKALFEADNIKIKKYTPKQLAAITAKMYFGGNEFEFKDNKLIYFSDGTNTYNYVRMFIQILSILTEIKIKEPILVLDEPEISLHHNMIDNLFKVIDENSANVAFVLSTHSARLIKNILIKNDKNSIIYHIKMIDLYSYVRKMKMFEEIREVVRISDQHANSYFSQMVVCVEGASEMELLQNRFLKLLYPVLEQVDVMQVMAEEVERKIVSPSERRYRVPILYTIDMDKIVEFNKEKRRLILKKNFIKYTDKYSFSQRRKESVGVRRLIEAMSQKCAFRYKMPIYFSNDSNLYKFKELLKKYYLLYDYFVMNTTIEGALITKENLSTFIEFLKNENNIENFKLDKIENLAQKAYEQEQLNIYRLACQGKCDMLMGMAELEKKNPMFKQRQDINNVYSTLNDYIVSKTNGWISRWIEYFICVKAGVVPFEDNTYQRMKYLFTTEQGDEIRNSFSLYFPELDCWISEMNKRSN